MSYVEPELTNLNKVLTAKSEDYYSAVAGDPIAYRNELVAERMYAIDVRYTAFENALLRERQNVGFFATLATLGLTTGSTLTTAVPGKSILSGLAGVVTGGAAAYNQEVLLKLTIQAIVNQMRATRDKVKTKILQKMTQAPNMYPLASAMPTSRNTIAPGL